MKILIVGGAKVWAIENYYKKYMNEAGALVEIFPIHDLFYQKLINNPIVRILKRLGFGSVYNSLNKQLKNTINSFVPDVVWVFKGMEVQASALRWIKNKNIKLVNYNPDHPFLFSGRGSGNYNVTEGIRLYDLHFCYHTDVMRKIEKDFQIPCVQLPFGFDLSEVEFEKLECVPEIIRACFIGNPDKQREKFILDFLNAGILVDVYGNDWDKASFTNHPNIKIFPPIFPPHFWQVARQYRIQLNIFRDHNIGSHNMRTFEIPGVGGIMLAPDSPEHRSFFENEKEAFFYETTEEAIAIARMTLSGLDIETHRIRENARRRSLESAYAYRDRAIFALEYLKFGHYK